MKTDLGLVALAAPSGEGEGFVELARTQQGRLFRKQILRMGSDFVHPSNPNKKIKVDQNLAESLVRNFQAGVCDIVQVPVANDLNQHVEDPLRNAGEVVNLSYDDKGVYAMIDARKYGDDFGKTLLGASALMHMNYGDTETGEGKGPTLLHVAVTNRPYLTNLEGFEEVIAASTGGLGGLADTTNDSQPVVMVPATSTEEKMELDAMLEALKNDHGIDVAELQEKAAAAPEGELLAALSNVLKPNAPKPEALTLKDVADAVVELAEEKVALSNTVQTLTADREAFLQREAEAEVDRLVTEGRILPKSRDAMVKLSRENREAFDAIVPDDSIVALSSQGVDTFDSPDEAKAYTENIDRLAAIANGMKK
jgi:hypothetical protein